MKSFVLLLFLLQSVVVSGQISTAISGTVVDMRGEPVPGANIMLENTYDGTSSDASGRFSFVSKDAGEYYLIVTFIGYKTFRERITLSDEPVVLAVQLREEISQLDAVTITAGSFTASDEGRRNVLKPLDIATTAGATADIAGALNTLPGTQKVGETGRLFVRGGDGDEARTFIDGMLVFEAYSPAATNTPSRGRFLPFMFKGTSFSTGGYSAEYGQALSSALVLDSRDESEVTRTDIGLLSVGGDVTHTSAWEGGSIAGKIQYTNIRPYFGLINQEVDWITPPASVEGISAFRQKTGKNGMVKFYGNFSETSFALFNHDIDDNSLREAVDLKNKYRYINASYKDILNSKWSVRGGGAYSYVQDETKMDHQGVTTAEEGFHGKAVLEGSLTSAVETRAGAEVLHRRNEEVLNFAGDDNLDINFQEFIGSLFSESDLYFSNRFVMRLGARLEYNSLIAKTGLDPRVSFAYKSGKSGQFSFAYGTFRQTAKNQYVRLNRDLDNEKSAHYILNYQHVNNKTTFRIETYYKSYSDLVKFSDESTITNRGHGYARGAEIFWRDNRSIRNLDYWVSYSFLDTKRDYLNFPYEATPSFASAHNFSLVGKYFVPPIKTQVGATYSYTSGRPYHNPNAPGFNASKTPDYHDLSFNLSYLARPNLIFYLSCTNVTGRDNIFGYEFGDRRNDTGQFNARAIRQPAPRFMFLGIFLTLSKDKTVSQLPTL